MGTRLKCKYVHTNIVALDYRRLAQFYEQVFGCVRVPPERDLSGSWIDAGTGVSGARIRGIHLRLPGYEKDGPTLEIFRYDPHTERGPSTINRPGLAHIAFHVDDVEAARAAVLAAGGGTVGEIVSSEIPGVGILTFVYVTDPEGNIIELQHIMRNP
jgi:predicted enzyme related to lactoylglutathione lyase